MTRLGYCAALCTLLAAGACGSTASKSDDDAGSQDGPKVTGSGGSGGGQGGAGGQTGTGGTSGTGGGTGGQDGGTGGKDGGPGGQGGAACTPAQEQEGAAFRASLLPEYEAPFTYDGGAMPATMLTIRLTDLGGKVNCIPRSANGGVIGYDIAVDVSFQFVTQDGGFNEKFTATLTKGFGSFGRDLDPPQGTYRPGAGFSHVVTLAGNIRDNKTMGVVWKKVASNCPCQGMPGCACPMSVTQAASWK